MKYFYLILILFIISENLIAEVIADFKVSKRIAYTTEELLFTNLSVGDSLEYQWYFGDLRGSNEENPIYAYSIEGAFDVKLIAFNSNEADTIIKENYITVHPYLNADFIYELKGATGGYSVNIQNTSVGNIKYRKWNFFNGFTTNDRNPTSTYDEPGMYNIRLVISDNVTIDSMRLDNIIEIPYPGLNIGNYNKEKILYDTGSYISEKYHLIENGFVFSTEGFDKYKVRRLNQDFNQLWTKSFNKKYLSSLYLASNQSDRFAVVLNSDVYLPALNIYNQNGDEIDKIIDPFGNYETEEYTISDINFVDEYLILTANYGKEGRILILDKSYEIIYDENICDDDCIVDEYDISFMKIVKGYNNNIFLFLIKENNLQDKKYFYSKFVKNGNSFECSHISNGLCIAKELNNISFEANAVFKVYNESDMLFLNGRKVFNAINFESDNPEIIGYTNLVHTEINDIHIINDEYFAAVGKFNGHMKLSITKMFTNKVIDYLTNRLGYFTSLDLIDNNIICSGTIKKNYYEKGIYFLNIPFQTILSVDEQQNRNIKIYPNPAEDYIEITVGSHSSSNGACPIVNDIAIYDMLGNVVWKSTANTHTPALSRRERVHRIDISHLPSGVYFVSLGDRIEKFVKR